MASFCHLDHEGGSKFVVFTEKKAKRNIGSTYLEVIFVVDVCVLVQGPIVAEPQHLGENVLLPQLAAHPG